MMYQVEGGGNGVSGEIMEDDITSAQQGPRLKVNKSKNRGD